MTNPTLERAARALAGHFGCEWETMSDADRETTRGYCRAVLMAVREPDEVMNVAGCQADDPLGGLTDWTSEGSTPREGVSRVFTAMIDAILAEGEI